MRRRSWPWGLLGFGLGLVVALLVGLGFVGPQALIHRQPGDLERAYGSAMIGLAARFNGPREMPRAASSERGRQVYADACGQCHGASGDGKGMFGQTSFPPATDLTSGEVRGRSDAELFWIVKNGLGFTAMPGYAGQLQDADIAAAVSYVRELQHASH